MVLLPTFPMLRAGESHNRKKTKFLKLLEALVFFRSGLTPASFLSKSISAEGIARWATKGRICRLRLDFVNLVRERAPLPVHRPRPPGE